MITRSPVTRNSDLSAQTKHRQTAGSLLGTDGFAGSVRTITDAAGCSLELVSYHLGIKGALQEGIRPTPPSVGISSASGEPMSLLTTDRALPSSAGPKWIESA